MLHKAIQQFLEDVDWGELDYLLVDLPPGTGDVSMTLAQLLPQAKMLLVTTPQPAAQKVAHRAAEMASKFDLDILGVVENMSGFTAPDGSRYTIFGEGGGSYSQTRSTTCCWGRFRFRRSCVCRPMRACHSSSMTRTHRRRRRSRTSRAGSWPPLHASCPSFRWPRPRQPPASVARNCL